MAILNDVKYEIFWDDNNKPREAVVCERHKEMAELIFGEINYRELRPAYRVGLECFFCLNV